MELLSNEIARFHRSYTKTENSCWIWNLRTKKGYGEWTFTRNGKQRRTANAHRISYTLLVGEIPEGLVLDHLCRTKNCVNPAHLEPVSNEENIRRALKYSPTWRYYVPPPPWNRED